MEKIDSYSTYIFPVNIVQIHIHFNVIRKDLYNVNDRMTDSSRKENDVFCSIKIT